MPEETHINHEPLTRALSKILVMFCYRLVEWYINGATSSEKTLHLNTLQIIYEMGGIEKEEGGVRK